MKVELAHRGEDVLLTVTDNGRGFPTDFTDRPGHLGLVGARERVAAINGTIEFRNGTDHGATVPRSRYGSPSNHRKKKSMKRILIVDDHDVVRTGLQRIIIEHLVDVEFGDAADTDELLLQAKESEWDLIISDIKMPGRSGLDILKELRTIAPDTPVIILTAFPESDYGARALEQGASGFINKARVSSELPNAIRKVLTGHRYVSPQLAEALADYLGGKPTKDAHSLLSEREMQVTRLIAIGKETGEIASDLSLSEKTIATYRARIYEKLSVKNNVELTRYALKHKLVE